MSERNPFLFDSADLPEIAGISRKNFRSLDCPLWTQNKSRLIQEYIKLFSYVTKHGAYIDGFAAPQRREHSGQCSAKLVLEVEPKRLREFWLCDKDPRGISLLDRIKSENEMKGRRIHLVPGDFNVTVDGILRSGRIKEGTAAFALLDQRTFECAWSTVQKLAAHKTTTKIEMFYFLATGWMERAIAATRTLSGAAIAERWWGGPDWRKLKDLHGVERAYLFGKRFAQELGYTHVYPYPIHDESRGGRVMYYMIHATDHSAAPPLMLRAYRKTAGRRDWAKPVTQADLSELWG